MAFCRQCGSPVGDVKFCSKCGAAVLTVAGTTPVSPAAPPPAPIAPSVSALPQQAPSQGSSVLVKVLVAFLVFVLLVILAVMGSCVYIGYRAKKKADEIQQAYKTNDLNKLAGALGVGIEARGRFLERSRIVRQRIVFGAAFFSRVVAIPRRKRIREQEYPCGQGSPW